MSHVTFNVPSPCVVLVLLVKAPDKLFLPFTGYTTRRSLLLALYTCQET